MERFQRFETTKNLPFIWQAVTQHSLPPQQGRLACWYRRRNDDTPRCHADAVGDRMLVVCVFKYAPCRQPRSLIVRTTGAAAGTKEALSRKGGGGKEVVDSHNNNSSIYRGGAAEEEEDAVLRGSRKREGRGEEEWRGDVHTAEAVRLQKAGAIC